MGSLVEIILKDAKENLQCFAISMGLMSMISHNDPMAIGIFPELAVLHHGACAAVL